MKTKFILFFLLISKIVSAQESADKTVYLDSLRKETTEGNHKYYKIIKDYKSGKSEYTVLTYLKTGVILSEATSSDKEGKIYNGDATFYYENGNKRSVLHYVDNYPQGKATYWYENGQMKEEGENPDTMPEYARKYKTVQFWNEKNEHTVVDGNGFSIKEDKDYYEKLSFKNGYKDGILTSVNHKNNTSYSEVYENGNFVSGERIDSKGEKKAYLTMEKKPEPKKGMQDFFKFIGGHFKYTKESMANKIQGKIIMSFVVNSEGKIVEPKIIKGLGYGLDEEAIRVVTSYDNWSPGEQRGIPIRCLYTLPLSLNAQ